MASSSSCQYLFLLTFLLTLLSMTSLSTATTRDEAQQAIQSGITYLYIRSDEIHASVVETIIKHDNILHDKYNKCGVLYKSAMNAYIQCHVYLQSGDIKELPSLAAFALQEIQTCDKIFTPPGSETRFKKLNEEAIDVCNKVLAAVQGLSLIEK